MMKGIEKPQSVLTLEETEVMTLTISDLIAEQFKDPVRKTIEDQVVETGKPFGLDQNVCTLRRSSLDGSLQKVVRIAPRQTLLHLRQHPLSRPRRWN